MNIIDTLVIDRSQSDLTRLTELKQKISRKTETEIEFEEWQTSMKGAYNASDLNRVGEACAYLFDLFTGYGYAVPGYTALRDNWDDEEIPTAANMAAYLGTVAALKAVLNALQEIPDTMNRLTVDGANNIEKLLIEVDDQLRRMAQSFVYSGMVYSGQLWG